MVLSKDDLTGTEAQQQQSKICLIMYSKADYVSEWLEFFLVLMYSVFYSAFCVVHNLLQITPFTIYFLIFVNFLKIHF